MTPEEKKLVRRHWRMVSALKVLKARTLWPNGKPPARTYYLPGVCRIELTPEDVARQAAEDERQRLKASPIAQKPQGLGWACTCRRTEGSSQWVALAVREGHTVAAVAQDAVVVMEELFSEAVAADTNAATTALPGDAEFPGDTPPDLPPPV